MTIPTSGSYVVKPANHRCFDHLVTAQATLLLSIKGNLVAVGATDIAGTTGGLFSQMCFAGVEIHFTPNRLLPPILKGGWPTEIELSLGDAKPIGEGGCLVCERSRSNTSGIS
jgi:hypothetical protein